MGVSRDLIVEATKGNACNSINAQYKMMMKKKQSNNKDKDHL
jgi:hypothetical protein